jgi:hypothetical protein
LTDEARLSPAATVSHAPISKAADEAIRIADTHLRGFSIEKRKALAVAIVEAITRCEADFAAEILERVIAPEQLIKSHRPEGHNQEP